MLIGFHASCITFSAKDLCRSLMYAFKIQSIVSLIIHFLSFSESTDPAYLQNAQIHTHISLCLDVESPNLHFEPTPKIVLYDYCSGRGGDHPIKFLAGFTGMLQTHWGQTPVAPGGQVPLTKCEQKFE